MTRNRFTRFIAAAALLGGALASAPARAQGPDIRSVPPLILMLIDTSGSMEKVGDCACVTPSCTECLPSCSAANPDRNRWTTVLEALTGTVSGFDCSIIDRNTAAFAGEPDHRYFIPHVEVQGTNCVDSSTCPAGLHCSADDTADPTDQGFCQEEDGILDVYRDRAKFGLMTFDATTTFLSAGELMTRTDFLARGVAANEGAQGGYSYQDRRPFSFPGCGEPYMIDNGARNDTAPAGGLVSVGQEGVDTIQSVNQAVQGALLAEGMRPYGATPIAGMLSDANDYFQTHPDTRRIAALGLTGDPFNQCRKRFAILLTDGQPTSDMRGNPVNCDALAAPVGENGCPYDTPVVQAAQMLASGVVDGLYVVGFDVTGDNCPASDARCQARATETVATLNDLAAAGGTTQAVFANDRASLTEALTAILDEAAPGTTTRTIPAFGGSAVGTSQLQFNTGFNVTTEEGQPWSGVLERRRVECNGLAPEAQPIEDRDRFQLQLNNQTGTILSNGEARRLLTVVPTDPLNYAGRIIGQGEAEVTALGLPIPTDTRPLAQDGVSLVEFRRANSQVSRELFGVPTDDRRNEIIDWVHGAAGTERADRRLGSIYNSSPVFVSPPTTDLLDEGFNLFRQRPEVLGRPTMVYVG
ncbi:MAG: hypothetical protein AAF645_11370, partial [Myxococcota bacterium]